MANLRRACLWVSLGLAACSLALQLGRWNAAVDAAVQLCPLLALAILATLVLALALRAFVTALPLSVAILSLMSLAVDDLRPLRSEPPPAPGADLVLVQMNVWARNLDPAGTAAWILAQHPDAVALEEGENAGYDVRSRLEAAGYHAPGPCYRSRHRCRSVVLSRWPILDGGGVAHRPLWLPVSYATLEGPFGRVTIFAAHLGWPWPPNMAQRQRDELSHDVVGLDHATLIVAGDFNASPWSFGLRRLGRNLGLERRTRLLPSWPARRTTGVPFSPPLPFLALDHVFAGSAWRTIEVRRGPRLGSDHYPVVVRLRRAAVHEIPSYRLQPRRSLGTPVD